MDFILNVFFRNNCEVPCDDFEYFDSRNNNCERIKHIAEKTPVVPPVVDSVQRGYKNKGKNWGKCGMVHGVSIFTLFALWSTPLSPSWIDQQ